MAAVSLQSRVRAASERGFVLGAVVLAAYAWLAPAYIVDGDNAEFCTLGAVGGVPHPSGYPLYLLWLRATSWLPAGSAAHRAALATAVLGATAVVVLHAACRAWGARPLAATFACAVFAAAPIAVRAHVEAEVFALNNLAAAAILWVAASPLRGARRVAALGLVAGLGLANHLTCALLAPVGLVSAVAGVREAPRKLVAVGGGLAAFALGLTPYLYLLVAPDNAAGWHPIDSLGELVDHVLRRDYGGPGAFSGGAAASPVADNVVELARSLGRGWLWAPLALAAVTLARRIAGKPERALWAALAVTIVLAGPLLVARFDLPTSWVSVYVARRFHVLPLLLLAVPIAVGLDPFAARAKQLPGQLAGCALFAVLAMTSLRTLGHAHSPALELGVGNLLRSLPPDAVVLQSQDPLYFGAAYLQLVDGERPDVVVVEWSAASLSWYRQRLARRGVDLDGDEVAVAERLLAAGRPVFADVYQPALAAALPSYPYSMLRRVLPRGAEPPSLDDQLATNKRLYAAFDLDYEPPDDDDEFAADIHRKYATTWLDLARALAHAGRADDAAWARALGHELAPR